jgi:hypothetical protein
MRDLRFIRKIVLSTGLGLAVLTGLSASASAQNIFRESRQLQAAQQRAQIAHQRYLRTRRPSDYQAWQNAQAKVQREQFDYQRAASRSSSGGYYNNTGGFGNGVRSYRINRGGTYYNVDQRQVELLRSAVQQGYSQGYRQGQIDRQYRRSYNYGTHSLYRSGSYGYQSYVARDQYQYYFQQGFQRGYEDGFNSTYRYGARSGNGINILGGILNTILQVVD